MRSYRNRGGRPRGLTQKRAWQAGRLRPANSKGRFPMRNPEENAGVEPEVTATTPLSEAKLIELIEGYLGVLMANYATKDEVETALAAFWAYHNRQAENSAEVARCINDA